MQDSTSDAGSSNSGQEVYTGLSRFFEPALFFKDDEFGKTYG